MKSKNWYVYIVRASDGSFYTGVTNDLNKRILVHNSGKGAKALRGKLPVELVYFEKAPKSDAMRREVEIKKMTRAKKEQMVDSFEGN